jgi:hypothetical protein
MDYLHGEVTGRRYKKDLFMKIKKDTEIFKSKKEQIEIIK